jgi:hypothetical protein
MTTNIHAYAPMVGVIIITAVRAHKQALIAGIAVAVLVVYMWAPMSAEKAQKTTTTTPQNIITQRATAHNAEISCLSACNNTDSLSTNTNIQGHTIQEIRRHFSLT